MMQANVDPQTLTITFERHLKASREDAFDAWTRPEQLREWWDASGKRLAKCEVDLRPGGAFCFVNQGQGHPFTGTYAVIERPARLVFEAMGAIGTVVLEAAAGGTHMRVTIRCASKEGLEQFVQMGIAAGTDRTLDNLVRLLENSPAARVQSA